MSAVSWDGAPFHDGASDEAGVEDEPEESRTEAGWESFFSETESGPEETLDWKEIHERLVGLAARRARIDAEEATWLIAGLRAEVHRKVGYGSFLEYLERVFGYGPRFAIERIRVARALERLPVLFGGLEEGAVPWSTVRELTRIAVPETEAEWLKAAAGKTVREVERMVSGLEPGDRPGDARRESARRHILRFEVSAETFATFREAERLIVEELGRRPEDDDMLLELARRVLQGPGDAGRSGYQVAMTVCAHCEQGWIDGGGDPVAVGSDVLEMASCDAVDVGWLGDDAEEADGVERPGAVAQDEARDETGTSGDHAEGKPRAGAHGCTHGGTHMGTGHGSRPTRSGRQDCDCDAGTSGDNAEAKPRTGAHGCARGGTHMGTGDGSGLGRSSRDSTSGKKRDGSKRRRRARQEIPPSVRRAVFRRDRGQCIVPGCRCAVFLDAHHLDPLSEGGSNDPDNLCLLCGNHHRAVHRGLLIIEGRPLSGLRFLHADGTVYGGAVSTHEADLRGKAFRGLRGLGMTELDARRAVSSAHVGPRTTLEELIKEALAIHRSGGQTARAA